MTVDSLSTLVQRRHSDVHGGQPVIDATALATLQDLAGEDDREFLLEVVDMFLQDAFQRVQSMQGAIRELDWEAVAKDAHSLKSASANVGALPFAETCARLECAIRECAETEMLPQATRVAEMFEDVHTKVLVGAPGDFFDLRKRFFRKGLLEMIEGDGFTHRDAEINKISNKAAQAKHRQPRQPADEKTDAQKELIL